MYYPGNQIESKKALKNTEYLLPHVHQVASLLKRWLLDTHQNYTSESYLQCYLDEFIFRYNRREKKASGLLFERIIEQVVNRKPILYKEIIVK